MMYFAMKALLSCMIEVTYYHVKAAILALAAEFFDGDETQRDALRKKADFFPLSQSGETSESFRSMMVRVGGELFLVENTQGGEKGVFALLFPLM